MYNKYSKFHLKTTRKTLIIAVLVMIVTIQMIKKQVFYRADMIVSDIICQQPMVVSNKIYIIAIDDATLKTYGSINTWDRSLSAVLVEKLNVNEKARPAVIGFDVIYSENGSAEGDQQFAKACKQAGNVVVAMNLNFKGMPEQDEAGNTYFNSYHIESVTFPYTGLREVSTFGFANTILGKDGYVRRAMAYVDDGDVRYNSFATQVYSRYQESRGKIATLPKLDENNQYMFSYTGKSGCYSIVSMKDVLQGTIDPRIFTDSIVLVGAYAVGMQDSYTPSIAHGEQMYGVEIQGNIIEALLEGKTQQSVPRGIYAWIVGVYVGLFYIVLKKVKILPATIMLFMSIAAEIVVIKIVYRNGWVIPTIVLPIMLVLIYAVTLVRGYLKEILRRKRVTNVFKQYVAPQVVDKISKEKNYNLVLGGENREIACLFVDIRGFTTMSEDLQPEEVVEILNEYLTLATTSIFEQGGTLDKFIGDAAMAVFNAPFDLDDYIYKAVRTAWRMKQGADVLDQKLIKRYGKSIAFGIGIHCGNAVVGNIGCDFRMDYTAIGDTVNTAARLQSNAEQGQILVSQAVYEAVKDRVNATCFGELSLKGKSQGVVVYQIDEVIE